jgi:hypothetical protein
MENNSAAKTFFEVLQENKDKLFVIKDGTNSIRATMCHNTVSGDSYFGVKLSFMDDNYGYIRRNTDWILDLHTDNIREVLKEQGFSQVEPTALEKILYSGHPLLNQRGNERTFREVYQG